MIKVKDLIKQLQKFPQDSIVVLSSDEEGNNFSPAYECTNEFYVPSTGELGDEEKGSKKAVVIWPTS